jgi:hypothetical protein
MEFNGDIFNCCAVGEVVQFPEDNDLCNLKGRTYKENLACEDCRRGYDSKDREYWEPTDACRTVKEITEVLRFETRNPSTEPVRFAATNNFQLKAGEGLASAGWTKYRVFKNPNSSNTVTIWHYWKGPKGSNIAPSMA